MSTPTSLLAAGLGWAAGMRSMTPPAVLARTLVSQRPSIPLLARRRRQPARVLGTGRAATLLTVAAAGELTADKLPVAPPRTSPRQHLAPMVTLPRRGPPRGPMTKGHGPTETRGPPGSGRSRFGSRWVSWPSSLSGSRQHRGGPRPHRRVLVTRRPGRPQKHSRSPRSRRRVRLRRRTNRPAAQLDRPWKRRSPSRKHPRAQRRAPQAGHRFIAHPKSSKPTAERAGPRFPTS